MKLFLSEDAPVSSNNGLAPPQLDMHEKISIRPQLLQYCAIVSILLLSMLMLASRNFYFIFLIWNLALAWLPYFFTRLIEKEYRKISSFSSKPSRLTLALNFRYIRLGMLVFLWLIFFANAPYVITDFIHLGGGYADSYHLPFDNIWFLPTLITVFAFAFSGFLYGLCSMAVIHKLMMKWRTEGIAILAVISLLSGIAIYIGRFLRWNSWDVIVNPAGLLANLFNHISNPAYTFYFLGLVLFFSVFILGSYLFFTAFFEFRFEE